MTLGSESVKDICAQFQEDGYLVLRQVFSPVSLKLVVDAAEALKTKAEVHPNNIRCRFHLHPETGASLLEALDPVTDLSDTLQHLAKAPQITQILRTLLAAEPKLFKDKMIFKPPGARGYALHQDYIHWPLFPRSFTTVVVALDEATAENGCIEVFPGLHKHGCFAPLDGDYHDLPVSVISEVRPVPLALKPGDIAVFGCFMPHRSAANSSGETRRQLYFSYNAEHDGGDQRAFHYQYFHRWIRSRYGEYGASDLYYR